MVEIRRIGPQIGVEVTGVDVRTLDDAGFAPIYQAWLDHNVMVVRDQELTIEEFLRYSRRFGVVVPHPLKSTRHPEVPEITLLGVGKFDADGRLNQAIYRRGAEGWHTDGAYDADPFKATQLYALAIPSTGGDTLFANGYAAYETLPDGMKRRIEGRKALNAYDYDSAAMKRGTRLAEGVPSYVHPVVRTHPATGRKALYVNRLMTVRIEGLSEQESEELLATLFDHQERREFVYEHVWHPGDLLMWDNRCTLHARTDFSANERRLMRRVTILGEKPV
jgi:taurine dioxygenase